MRAQLYNSLQHRDWFGEMEIREPVHELYVAIKNEPFSARRVSEDYDTNDRISFVLIYVSNKTTAIYEKKRIGNG